MRAQEVAVIEPLARLSGGRNDLRLIGPREAARRAPTVAVELAGPTGRWPRRGSRGIAWGGDFMRYARFRRWGSIACCGRA
jgi:hypothetical protein